MMSQVQRETEKFFDHVYKLHLHVFPLNGESDIDVELDLNADNNTGILELHVPLVYGAGAMELSRPVEFSDLFESVVRFHTTPSRNGRDLSIKSSKFELRVGTAPGVRFEYERDNKGAPTAHIHHSGVAGLLSPALMKSFFGMKNSRKKGRIEDIHFPVGGRRFRVSVEEYFSFLFKECGFHARPGWEGALHASRQEWLETQLAAAVADNPYVAAATLRSLGFVVADPS